MSSSLFELGRFCYRHAGRVIGAWLVVLALLGIAAGVIGEGTSEVYEVPGSQGQEALDSLQGRFPELSGAAGQIVVVAPEGRTATDSGTRADVDALVSRLEKVDGVSEVADPYDDGIEGALSDDGRAALVNVQLDGQAVDVTDETRDALTDSVGPLRRKGYTAEVGGSAFMSPPPTISFLEVVGLVVAMIVLYVMFRSLRAAALPLVSALAGAGATGAVIMTVTAAVDVPGTAPLLALMIGVAVGIDYALFILARHREQLAGGSDPEESAALSIATAGGAVVFAGLTVLIALLGLSLAGLPFLSTMGVAASGGVAIAVLSAITLLPALMGRLGARLVPRGARDGDGTHHSRWAHGWVRAVTAAPLVTVVLVTAALVALSVPALDLRLALPDNGSMALTESPRREYDLVAEHFGPGDNGPLLVTADIIDSDDPLALMDDLEEEIAAVPGVERVTLSTPNRKADTGVVVAIPETGPTDARTADLVRDLRDRLPSLEKKYDTKLAVTGHTAIQIDVSDRLARATLPFALVVMGLSLLLLTIVFRSLLVPLTATLGFVLSTTAAFGVIAGVFEHGWFSDVFGVTRLGPVISFMPIIVMGVLFGLAMDYQVFLVSRMREAHVRGASPKDAVVRGFTSSGPVVAAAAAIMVAVFASFVPHGDANLKPIALGLAVGVLLDAFVVRMIFIPAALALCGRHTWEFPAVLDRTLPHMDVEGGVVHDHLERNREVREHPNRVVEARGVTIRGGRGVVVSDLDLAFDEPGVCLVQGPDGSGKTSILLALAGRMPFEQGVVEVAGYLLPEQAAAVQRRVALAEMHGINDLDDALTVAGHIAERLSARTLMPWARRRDIDRVMNRFTAALVAAREVKGAVVPRTQIDPTWYVGDLNSVERELLGVVLALVEQPRVLVLDENGELRSEADRWAVVAGVGHLVRSARETGQTVSVIGASTEPMAREHIAHLAGVPVEEVTIVEVGRHQVGGDAEPRGARRPVTAPAPGVGPGAGAASGAAFGTWSDFWEGRGDDPAAEGRRRPAPEEAPAAAASGDATPGNAGDLPRVDEGGDTRRHEGFDTATRPFTGTPLVHVHDTREEGSDEAPTRVVHTVHGIPDATRVHDVPAGSAPEAEAGQPVHGGDAHGDEAAPDDTHDHSPKVTP
ncbi:MMPL family transporter [Mobilicoccus pelagius]|uniref:SSD domain-containing protein n=1 Tax=Mobilicoccus pelagius NBRC 104925 TaxID=1089455 RepID=H5UQ18_9MICO|nr:MMPL family transporter [Mobilicoccus pelagius]GAB47823.1 hypothetical protein MOPEL_029_01040 [Mobilicoccus pelagius NBRC 104925]